MDEGLHGKLTHVSAPAGFGKTTLVSAWIAKAGRTFGGLPDESVDDDFRTNTVPEIRAYVAWLSLDEGDNDSTRFLTYLVAALQTLAPTVGQGILDALHSPQPPPHESLLTALLNEIATLPEGFSIGSEQGFVLVFDDYHVLNAKPVHDILTFFFEHLPTQINLIITTRNDVVATPDGGFLVTHLMTKRSGALGQFCEFIKASLLGSEGSYVLAWQRDEGFAQLAGSQGIMANGIEISPDAETMMTSALPTQQTWPAPTYSSVGSAVNSVCPWQQADAVDRT